jgi:tRNA threonylcarbamoyl adenosine modification protein YeaZ
MYLCVDTISEAAGITLADSNSAFHLPLDPMKSSEGIIDTIDKALKKAKIGLPDLKGVFVVKGPGSFTGLRVGLTVANQFAHQLKIPIHGLRTDEWWLTRTSEPATLYLQTMNKAEVYLSKDGETSIEDVQKLSQFGPAKWLGQLSDDHRSWLPSDFEEIKDMLPIEKTWQKVIQSAVDLATLRQTYEIVEPFYGKEPAITESRKKLSLR